MRDFAVYGCSIGVAAAFLAGCVGSQPPIGAPGAMPQTPGSASARTTRHLGTASASYNVLYRFHSLSDGYGPEGALLDVSGRLYGSTLYGGSSGKGTVYRVGKRGAHEVIYSFGGGSDGVTPMDSLLDVNGTLYGTTRYGGSSSAGTVYTVTPSGAEKVLYSFKGGSDGTNPAAGLIDVNGTLYGTTLYGGGTACPEIDGCGTIFSITTSGQETVLYRFAGGTDGEVPQGELTDVNGVLYGTTAAGGTASGSIGNGTVYSVTTSGEENVLYRFKAGLDGAFPESGLTNVSGTLYGTTSEGNGGGCGGVGCGTVFQIGVSGSGYSKLHGFQGDPDGATPSSAPIALQGTLYGTTYSGGLSHRGCYDGYGCGTIYSISASGAETVLYRFGSHDGVSPAAPLTNVNGTLYGATIYGGDQLKKGDGYGTIFALTP